MIKAFYLILFLFLLQCSWQNKFLNETAEEKKIRQDDIIEEYLTNCAENYNYRFQMAEWQNCLDDGLKKDSTIAYLWQKKAMPYFKARKYEIGMKYLDKAVLYKPERWLSYRAFIKCIFAKTYKEAIIDFEKCIKMEGNSYVMDHTYKFHIGLSYLQLNEFLKAEAIFDEDIKEQEKQWGEAHLLDLFYNGISKYEQGKWEEAISKFDQSLKQYPNFSDVLYYKAICLIKLNRLKEYEVVYKEAQKNAALGNTIHEDNSIYETYPYQVRW
jgi:tetratricopeptide (TPR) repeat protein